jgi:hypothetical protein
MTESLTSESEKAAKSLLFFCDDMEPEEQWNRAVNLLRGMCNMRKAETWNHMTYPAISNVDLSKRRTAFKLAIIESEDHCQKGDDLNNLKKICDLEARLAWTRQGLEIATTEGFEWAETLHREEHAPGLSTNLSTTVTAQLAELTAKVGGLAGLKEALAAEWMVQAGVYRALIEVFHQSLVSVEKKQAEAATERQAMEQKLDQTAATLQELKVLVANETQAFTEKMVELSNLVIEAVEKEYNKQEQANAEKQNTIDQMSQQITTQSEEMKLLTQKEAGLSLKISDFLQAQDIDRDQINQRMRAVEESVAAALPGVNARNPDTAAVPAGRGRDRAQRRRDPNGPNLEQRSRYMDRPLGTDLSASMDSTALSSDDEKPDDDTAGFQRPKTMLSYLSRQFEQE